MNRMQRQNVILNKNPCGAKMRSLQSAKNNRQSKFLFKRSIQNFLFLEFLVQLHANPPYCWPVVGLRKPSVAILPSCCNITICAHSVNQTSCTTSCSAKSCELWSTTSGGSRRNWSKEFRVRSWCVLMEKFTLQRTGKKCSLKQLNI